MDFFYTEVNFQRLQTAKEYLYCVLVVFLNLCVGGVLFNTYICDIFFDIIESDIASYADDNPSYNFYFSLNNVTSNLDKSI